MAWNDKVVWQEGMFLRSQHFQQADRYTEHLVQMRAAPLRSHPWGVTLCFSRFCASIYSSIIL